MEPKISRLIADQSWSPLFKIVLRDLRQNFGVAILSLNNPPFTKGSGVPLNSITISRSHDRVPLNVDSQAVFVIYCVDLRQNWFCNKSYISI